MEKFNSIFTIFQACLGYVWLDGKTKVSVLFSLTAKAFKGIIVR